MTTSLLLPPVCTALTPAGFLTTPLLTKSGACVDDSTAYFEKWALGFTLVLMQRGVLTHADLGEKLGIAHGGEGEMDGTTPRFKPGDAVIVRQEDLATAWTKPHLRTPGYIFGKAGTVERVCGSFDNPELLTIGLAGPSQPLYRIRFRQSDVWKEYGGHPNDTVDVEVYQPWLEGTTVGANFTCEPALTSYLAHTHEDGVVESRGALEQQAVDSEGPERPYRRVVEAIKMCLLDKGLVTNEAIRFFIEQNDMNKQDATLGAQVVAKAWTDPVFRQLLLKDGASALAQLGIDGTGQSADLIVVENNSTQHNLVVCTLCSCCKPNHPASHAHKNSVSDSLHGCRPEQAAWVASGLVQVALIPCTRRAGAASCSARVRPNPG